MSYSITKPPLEDWQARVVTEKAELDAKIAALEASGRLAEDRLLSQQHQYMVLYSGVLGVRIGLF